jgi:hypothetical protein
VVQRQKNLLEAFRASAREESAAPTNQSAATGGPFVDEAAPERAPRAGLSPAARVRILVALAVLALVWVAWELGRSSARPAEAAGARSARSTPSGPSGVGAAPPATAREERTLGEPSAGARPEEDAAQGASGAAKLWGEREPTRWDKAFADPTNSMSVRVIEYKNTEQGRRLAYDCYQYLLREALPAVWPIQQGSSLILYVGASSDKKVLEDLKQHVSKLAGPPPLSRSGEFADAYLVNIDDWVAR